MTCSNIVDMLLPEQQATAKGRDCEATEGNRTNLHSLPSKAGTNLVICPDYLQIHPRNRLLAEECTHATIRTLYEAFPQPPVRRDS